MAELYNGGHRSGKKATKRERKAYIRKLKQSYQQGEILKKKMIIQKKHDEEEADSTLKDSLDLI